jgi:ABC-type lipoprotein export system ATPase subunit
MPHTAACDVPLPGGPHRAAWLTLEDVTVTVPDVGSGRMPILDIPALKIAPGETVGIAGASGAGKTTLLHVIGGLLLPSTGVVAWGADPVSRRSEDARDGWRRRMVGFVFQDFALVPELSVLDNILLPATFGAWRVPSALRREGASLAEIMGLTKLGMRAASLSRGEQQRVAVARALLGKPALLLADEPTASLDAENGASVAGLLLDGAHGTGATLIVISHDAALLGRLDRVLRLDAGRIVADSAP